MGGIIIYYQDYNHIMMGQQLPQTMMGDMPGNYCFGQNKQSLAMAYFIIQPEAKNVYDPETALKQGTLFPELDKPFLAYKEVR